MRLTEAQSSELLRAYGAYVMEACDRCGAALGPTRWTILGELGAWCSRRCRNGVDHQPGLCRGCGTSLAGKRRGAMYCGRTCRMRKVRQAIQECANIVNTPIQDKGLTDAISGFGYGGSGRATEQALVGNGMPREGQLLGRTDAALSRESC
jgi:hypothetical protein